MRAPIRTAATLCRHQRADRHDRHPPRRSRRCLRRATSTTPNLDRLAREGAWAPQADVPVPLTRPSHVSLFTGRYPAEHGIRDNLSPPFSADVPLLAERLPATRVRHRRVRLVRRSWIGNRGWRADSMCIGSLRRRRGPANRRREDRRGDRVDEKPRSRSSSPGCTSTIPTRPTRPRSHMRPVRGTPVRRRGRVVRRAGRAAGYGATRAGTLDNTLVIVTSDHGEALGEHGEDVHGYFVYEATLRVPLIVRGPGVRPRHARSEPSPEPSIYFHDARSDAAWRRRTAGTQDEASRPRFRGERLDDEPAFAESLVPLAPLWLERSARGARRPMEVHPRAEARALRSRPRPWRAAQSGGPATSGARAPCARGSRPIPATRTASARKPSGAGRDFRRASRATGSARLRETLADRRIAKSAGADPKDKLEEYKALSTLMQQALVAMRAGRPAEAFNTCATSERRGLDSYELHFYLARAYAAAQQWREAAAEYEKATARFPGGRRGVARPRREPRRASRSARRDPRVRNARLDRAAGCGRADAARRSVSRRGAMGGRGARHAASPGDRSRAGAGTGIRSAPFSGADGRCRRRNTRSPKQSDANRRNGLYRYNHGLALQQLGRRDEAVTEFRQAGALGYRAP